MDSEFEKDLQSVAHKILEQLKYIYAAWYNEDDICAAHSESADMLTYFSVLENIIDLLVDNDHVVNVSGLSRNERYYIERGIGLDFGYTRDRIPIEQFYKDVFLPVIRKIEGEAVK